MVTRTEIDAYLEEACGKGIPYVEATDQASMMHGLAYILRQIEGTNSYKVNIGQTGPATSALRMALTRFAEQALTANETTDAMVDAAQGLMLKHDVNPYTRIGLASIIDAALEAQKIAHASDLEEAYMRGFMDSAQGYNGEHPHGVRSGYLNDDFFVERRKAAVEAIKTSRGKS